MLHEELGDFDIPHRTKIHNRVLETWDEHLNRLQDEMAGSMGKISFTTDMWSDLNLTPYMAVTAHWIEAKEVQTSSGLQQVLELRADLINFHRVPGHHSGAHLAHTFKFITDRIGITHKIGWITLDNASNNDTLMGALEEKLKSEFSHLRFNSVENRIRCFPHVVNLACKAVINAITSIDFAAPNLWDIEGSVSDDECTFAEAIVRDPISNVRTLVRMDLQLLCDVNTKWSSTLRMIEHALILREAIDKFLKINDFKELHKFQLKMAEWNTLDAFKSILQISHAFQQKLSVEKTPTLGNALPCFEAMARSWEALKSTQSKYASIINEGLNKLKTYCLYTKTVPAYILAMIINPALKLD
ncbi:Ribonuclease H-like domain containing protein [Russula decolorans]